MVSGDKESCVVIMNKNDYRNKMQQMINDGKRDGIYKVTEDNSLDDLKELRNYILCIIRVWSLLCSVRVYISLHFLPTRLVKLGFRLSVF